MKALSRVRFALNPNFIDLLFDDALLADLGAERPSPDQVIRDWTTVSDDELAEVEVLVTGWGVPRIDESLLARTPKLRGICHSAGSIRAGIDPVVYSHGIQVTTSASANAVPVAEFAQAMIILAAKQVFQARQSYRPGVVADHHRDFATSGTYRRKVGLVGASTIGRMVIAHLRAGTDLDLWVADPFLSEDEAAQLGVRVCSLEEVFSGCDVVSLHAPLLDSTQGMITAELLARLPDGATFINTARGGLVDHAALEAELVSGRIWGIIDTTDPHEPLPADSPLFGLGNVFLTPHIAGSQGNEIRRMGDLALSNAATILHQTGQPLIGEVTAQMYDRLA